MQQISKNMFDHAERNLESPCRYKMLIYGRKTKANLLLTTLKNNDDNPKASSKRMIRPSTAIIHHDSKYDSDMYTHLSGLISGSILNTMLSDFSDEPNMSHITNLITESKRLSLIIEIYASNDDRGFEEHYVIDNGILVINESKNIVRYNMDGFRSVLDVKHMINITISQNDFENESFVSVGGFKNKDFKIYDSE